MAFAIDIALITDAMSKGIAYAVDDASGGTYVFFDSAKHPSKVPTRTAPTRQHGRCSATPGLHGVVSVRRGAEQRDVPMGGRSIDCELKAVAV